MAITIKEIQVSAKVTQQKKEPNLPLSRDLIQQIKYLQPIITQYFIDNKSEIWLLFLIAHSKR